MKYFLKSNSGLESRFLWRYILPVYGYKELLQIFSKKVIQQGWLLKDDLTDWFQKHSLYFKAYGRDMEKLLTFVKIKHAKRIYGGETTLIKCITLQDMNAGYNVFKEQEDSDNGYNTILHSLYC